MNVEIGLLGPIEATVGELSIVPTATKQRRIMALLAMNAGRMVTVSTLMEEVWGTAMPRSAPTTLHTYIVHLRRRLEQALAGSIQSDAKKLLVTSGTGYIMDIHEDSVDAVRYGIRSAAGRQAVNDGDFEIASKELTAALAMWRGPVLVDVNVGPHLAIEKLGLEERRLSDLDLRIDADLRLGRHQHLLDELAVLCARHPMQENFHAQYILALYRAGRQSQAQTVYLKLRDSLVNLLGVEPAPRLQELHRAILSGDQLVDDPSFLASRWTPSLAR